MPNPFPGMNPFLEEPDLWPTVHGGLISLLWMDLNRNLPRGYVASIEERVYLIEPPTARYPDVQVTRRKRKRPRDAGVATAVLEADPAIDIHFPATDFRESFVEIHLARKPGMLVSVIEILSPTNKNPGRGRDLYLEKQQEMLASTAHFVEIDLLRAGRHTVAVPAERLQSDGFEYLVCLHRGGWQNRFNVWPASLRSRLPRFTVPLAGNDPDLTVDLQCIVNECYIAGRFDERLVYEVCPPPLSKRDKKWVDDVVRKAGLKGS